METQTGGSSALLGHMTEWNAEEQDHNNKKNQGLNSL